MPKQVKKLNLDSKEQDIKAHRKATSYLNKLCQSSLENDQRMYRLYRAANCNNPKELALFLNASTATISKVKKAGKIPAEWLLMLFQVKNVFPEWIQTGLGPMYLERKSTEHYEDGHTTAECMEDKIALQRLSSYALAEELLRRIHTV